MKKKLKDIFGNKNLYGSHEIEIQGKSHSRRKGKERRVNVMRYTFNIFKKDVELSVYQMLYKSVWEYYYFTERIFELVKYTSSFLKFL